MGGYYSEYHPGCFLNQRIFNEALEQANGPCRLETNEGNPLTVRLLVTADSIYRLSRFIQERSSSDLVGALTVLNIPPDIITLPDRLSWGTDGHTYTSGSGLPMKEPYLNDPAGRFAGVALAGEVQYHNNQVRYSDPPSHSFPLIVAHTAVFDFFTNYGSALDRFAWEVDMLFNLQINPRILDWGSLNRQNQINVLALKDQLLANRIKNYHNSSASRLLRYRSKLLHDGMQPITAVAVSPHDWEVRIPSNPDDPTSPLSIVALGFIQTSLDELVQFLDDCYGLLIGRLHVGNPPPW
jgi:hypothetical protein